MGGLHEAFRIPAVCCGLVIAMQAATAQLIEVAPTVFDVTRMADILGSGAFVGTVGIGASDGSKVPFTAFISSATCGGCGFTRGPEFVIVSPSSGVTPATVAIALNPTVVPYLRSGFYRLTVAFVAGGKFCSSSTPCGGADIFLTLRPQPKPSISMVVSAATLQPDPVAPGELISIFGEHLGTPPVSSQFDASGFYPTTLGNSTVTLGGANAALTYVSTTQINAMVPYGIAGAKSVEVVVIHNGSQSAPYSLPVADTSPGVFTATGTGTGQGAILNRDGSFNSVDNPAAKGSAITLFGTGSGLWSGGAGIWPDSVPDGSTFITATRPPAAPVSLTVDGQAARILYAGGAPFQPSGIIQVNAVLPDGIGSGPQPLVLTIGQNSNAQQHTTVAIR